LGPRATLSNDRLPGKHFDYMLSNPHRREVEALREQAAHDR
jgi:hypothetical protein